MGNVNVGQVLNTMATRKYIMCPFCNQEWTRLRPCRYRGEAGETDTYACVECAESVRALAKVVSIMQIDVENLEVSIFKRAPYSNLPGRYANPKSFNARVASIKPLVEILIHIEPPFVKVTVAATKTTVSFDNIFQAVSYFKNLMNQAENVYQLPDKKAWLD